MTFHKYLKIHRVGKEEVKDIFTTPTDEIIVQEKIDGANFRFMITPDNRIIFGSHNISIGDSTQEIGGNWKKCTEYISKIIGNYVMYTGTTVTSFTGYIFFGECMVKHTINYNWDKIPPFIIFDVMDIESGRYLEDDEAFELSTKLGFEFVKYVWRGTANEIPKEFFTDEGVPTSMYYSGKAEGLVFKNYTKQLMAKYVRQEFKEKNEEEFGKRPKQTTDDTEWFIATYYTNARIEKHIFKLIDEGNKLDMKITGTIIKNVYKDIWEEELYEIIDSKRKLDLEDIKKKGAIRCRTVLERMITNQVIING